VKAIQIAGIRDTPTVKEIPRTELGPAMFHRVAVPGSTRSTSDQRRVPNEVSSPVAIPYTLARTSPGRSSRRATVSRAGKVGDQVVARLDPKSGGGLAELAVIRPTNCFGSIFLSLVLAAGRSRPRRPHGRR